ncbi:hypothetical protein PsAD2_03020 [Pseudovibrio axinellae]|uniref:GpW n=1 Tax=Pseudovibrio axinellae TaxID=989403 RepID=A0A165XGJ3_9HYPH|nr:hypothetical protein [Pseudovibrio axinellae]KZL17683.1 hypothetical protein PsAD2_03020 [Pseudovibrio axinellae]SER43750.1 hypothetical protein SAMN05421798_11061 [Pseudovibrio axinellae]
MSDDISGLTTSEKKELLNKLEKARFSGAARVKFRDYDVEYKSDSEMVQAIRDLKQSIDAADGKRSRSVIRTNFSNGL